MRIGTELTLWAGMMFDGRAMHGPTTVHISDGRIKAVNTTGEQPEDDVIVDLGAGTCLLPGLVDAHVHLAFDASADPVQALAETGNTELLAAMRSAAGRMVRAGITTARDLGDRDHLALELVAELAVLQWAGPEILAAGPIAVLAGGSARRRRRGASAGPAGRRACTWSPSHRRCDRSRCRHRRTRQLHVLRWKSRS